MDTPRTRVVVRRLQYCHIPHDPNLEASCIAPYKSCYYGELEFVHSGAPNRIVDVILTIDRSLKLNAERFDPVTLEEESPSEKAFAFAIKEHLAVKHGFYEIEARDTEGVSYKCCGQFPPEC